MAVKGVDFSKFYECIPKTFWDAFENKQLIRILKGGAGSGKCFAKGTKVIMFSGKLENVENIKVGDLLMGPDSKPRKVIEVHSGLGNLYKVNQNKGMNYVVNEEHILTLQKAVNCKKEKGELFPSGNYRRPNGRYSGYPDIVNISIKEYLNQSKRWRQNFRGYKSIINFRKKKTFVDPYFLGIWLGDGSSNKMSITTMDKEIVEFINDYAEKENLFISICEKDKGLNQAKTYSFVGYQKNKNQKFKKNVLKEKFIKKNLLNNKHIPDEFIYNSRENRLKLLAGILDTDGSLQGNCYDFIQKNEKLAYQIKFLCNSLGFRCEIQKTKKSCMVNGVKFTGDYFRMNISGNVQDIPVKIERKKIKKFSKNKNPLVTGINVVPVGFGEYYGFEVEGDHLFLLEDCTVVHNSYFSFSEMIYEVVVNGCNYLVVRQTAVSNRTSTYSLTRQLISRFGLSEIFKENKTEMTFTCTINGAMIYYRGLEDVERLKSISFPGGSGILERIIFEESSEGNFDSFSQLLIRFRGKSKNHFQFTLLLNPVSVNNWVKLKLWDSNDFDIYRHHSTYKDNPFLDKNYEKTLLSFKSSNPNFFEIYANGNWGVSEGRIFNNTEIMPFPFDRNELENSEILAGCDWGFNHPTVLCLSVIKDGCLYTFDELVAYEATNKEFIEMVIEFDFIPKSLRVVYDSEDPARGKEFLNNGFSFIPSKKGKGSVLRTIDYLKSFPKWYIDPNRCPRLIQEVEQYSWRKDKDGKPLDTEPVNILDDAIDSVRYSIEHLANMKGPALILSGSKSDEKKGLIEARHEERKMRREVLKAQARKKREEMKKK